MAEPTLCPCKHGEGMTKNFIGEDVVFCELTAAWMNITFGECLGNCNAAERRCEQCG